MAKWATADIPDQTGRTAVITGANTGLGYETAAAQAAKGAHVVLAVHNLDEGKDARGIITADAGPGGHLPQPQPLEPSVRGPGGNLLQHRAAWRDQSHSCRG